MNRIHAALIALAVGPLAAWIALLQTGLIHSRGPQAAFAQGLVVGVATIVTYTLLRHVRR